MSKAKLIKPKLSCRRNFLMASSATAAGALLSAILPATAHTARISVVHALVRRNAYEQTNLAASTTKNFRINQQTATANGSTVQFDGSARFLFVTDSGTISAWTDRTTSGATMRMNGPSQMVFNRADQGMSFFGVAVKTDTWDVLWTADFGIDPQIRQFDKNFKLVPTQGFINPFATGEASDRAAPDSGRKARPSDPVPFNIQVVNGRVFVMYCVSQVLRNEAGFIIDACQFFSAEEDSLDAACEDKVSGFPNRGKLVEYTLAGDMVRIYKDLGRLNAPWGVAIAPANFGLLSNMLLVGNVGGVRKIAAFNQTTGRFIDFMRDASGNVIGLDGAWALIFGNGASLGDTNALYFAAGTDGEAAGLFGSLRYVG
jgi:hypothetical protein